MANVRSFRVSILPEKLEDWEKHLPVKVNDQFITCQVGLLQALFFIPANYNPHPQNGRPLSLTVDDSILGDIMSLLTKGEAVLTVKNLEPFTCASFRNNIQALLETCEQCYLKLLDKTSCLELWVIGDTYECRKLVSCAIKYIRENFQSIIQTESWGLLDKHRLRQLIEDIKALNVHSEEILCEAIVKWSMYERELRTEDLWELFWSLNLQIPHFYSPCPTVNPHETCFRTVCVGENKEGRLCQFEVEIKHGMLSLNVMKVRLPKEIDKDCAFQHCATTKRVYASTEKELWVWRKGNWVRLGKMPFSRSGHMVSHVKGMTFVFGGYRQNALRLTLIVQAYNREKQKWSESKELSCNVLFGHSVAVGSDIYMFGNTWKDNKIVRRKTLQRYNTASGVSEILPGPPIDDNASIERVIASPGGLLYIFTHRGDVLQYDPKTGSYCSCPSLPAPRRTFGAAIHGSTLYVFGGQDDHKYTITAGKQSVQNYSLDLRYPNASWKQCGVLNQPVKILS